MRCQGEPVGELRPNDSQVSFGSLGDRVDHFDRANIAPAERACAKNEEALVGERLRQSSGLEVALCPHRRGLELSHLDRGALPRIGQAGASARYFRPLGGELGAGSGVEERDSSAESKFPAAIVSKRLLRVDAEGACIGRKRDPAPSFRLERLDLRFGGIDARSRGRDGRGGVDLLGGDLRGGELAGIDDVERRYASTRENRERRERSSERALSSLAFASAPRARPAPASKRVVSSLTIAWVSPPFVTASS